MQKDFGYAYNKKIVPVNHLEGHISANYIQFQELKPPFVSLIISGGHTHLVDVKDYTEYEIIGRTMDDAVGEAFDKVARVVGLRISSVDLKLTDLQKLVKRHMYIRSHILKLKGSILVLVVLKHQ